MYKFGNIIVEEKLESNGNLCLLFKDKSAYLKPDEIKRLIQHLQNVIGEKPVYEIYTRAQWDEDSAN